MVLSGMRNFIGVLPSSVRNQPPTFTSAAVGLYSSMESTAGRSVCVSASLITTPATTGDGSSSPGEPPGLVLPRQLVGLSGFGLAFGFFGTSEKPKPSGVIGHLPPSL